ncbi:MAG: hypothetical protein Tsb0034_05660 [Ekhidna sp.]
MNRRPNRVKEVILRRSSFIVTLILLLGAFGLLRVVTTHKDIDDVANIDIPLIELLTQIETNQLEQAINFERAVRYAEEYAQNPEEGDLVLSRFTIADSAFRYLAKQVDLDLLAAEAEVQEALKRTSQESQRIKLRGLLLSVRKLENDHSSYEEHALEVLSKLEAGEIVEAIIASDRVEQEEDQFNKQIEGVLMRHEMFTESLVQLVEQEEVLSMKWIVTLTLLFIILSLLAVYSFSYRIWRPLEDIRNGAEKIGRGDLKARVRLRSNSITYDIVEAFNDMAARLDGSQQEIDRFIHFSYSTANDLKAPVTNLESLLGMLGKDDLTSANFQAVLGNAKRTTSQLNKTIDSLVTVNQIREELDKESHDLVLDDVLKEAVASRVEDVRAANATIKKDFTEGNLVRYPKRHLKIILEQLLANSLAFRHPERPLLIKIKAKQQGGKVTLIFNDNGLGFDAVKHREELWKPYTRFHDHVHGAGLGLYIVKMIIDHHGGAVRVESEPKKGATFALRLT